MRSVTIATGEPIVIEECPAACGKPWGEHTGKGEKSACATSVKLMGER